MGRNINTGSAGSSIGTIIKILLVAAVIFGIWYVINKTDFIANLKAKSEKTLEEITECSFSDIKYINTDIQKNIAIDEFVARYKDKKYKVETDMKKLSENGNVTFYVYSKDDTYEYKMFDLGDGYIKIVKDSATLYKEVQ